MKRFISVIAIIAMFTGILGNFTTIYADGEAGTQSNPYIIATDEDWKAASGKSGYFKLAADIEPTASFSYGTYAVLDMNGFSITTVKNKVFDVSKDLTVKNTSDNNSVIHCTAESGTNYVMMISAGNINIENVDIICDSGQAITVGSSGKDVNISIKDSKIFGSAYGLNLSRGNIVLENTQVTSKTNVALAVQGSASLTVNGGHFSRPDVTTNGAHIISFTGSGDIVINDAEVTNNSVSGSNLFLYRTFSGKLTINNGTFKNDAANNNVVILYQNPNDASSLEINNGSFAGALSMPTSENGITAIKGGSFSADPSKYVDAEKCTVTKYGDMYKVELKQPEKPSETEAPSDEKCIRIVAEYDDSGLLLKSVNITENVPVSEAIPKIEGNTKTMYWDSLTSMIPVTASKTPEDPTPTPTEEPAPTPTQTPLPDKPTPTPARPDLPEDMVWAEKWSYNFNEFTSEEVYSSTNKLTLPGAQAPSITFYKGTITSTEGLFGRSEGDYHLALTSSESGESARVFHNIDNVDAPVDNMIVEMDVAFTTTTEIRYLASYRTTSSMNGMVFSNDGRIGYYAEDGKVWYFKDSEGKDRTYEANTWYHIAIKFDFVEQTITYYLDTDNLGTVIPPNRIAMTSTSEICYKGTSNKTNPGTTYMDNFSISQEQNSYITSVMTSPENRTYLNGSEVSFTGYAKNSQGGGVDRTEFYIDGEKKYETTDASYSFTMSNLASGKHTVKAKSISSDGKTAGYSEEIELTMADYALPVMYEDGMLLQRNKPVRIAGRANDGAEITVSVAGQSKSAAAKNGKFEITLEPLTASKSTDFTITDGDTETTYNTAIGELILCNGQSNIAYHMFQFPSLQGLSDKDYEDIHLFKQDSVSGNTPQTDIPSGRWLKATQQEVVRFSAFGFGTGRKLYDALNEQVPVGLIYAAIGGTNINTWVPNGAYATDPDLYGIIAKNNNTAYNKMVAPWTDYTIGHVVWYQGEANTYTNQNYEKALTRYIDSLREAFRDESMDFTIIQLPVYDYAKAYKTPQRTAVEVRMAEWNVSQKLDNVATVVTIDTGDAGGIHPDDKLPLVERAANAILHFINPSDETIRYKSPSYVSFTMDGDNMILNFKDIYDGLTTKDGEAPKGFKIAGDDNEFTDAAARLDGNTIVIDTSSVTGTPKVRYAFEDAPALAANNKNTMLNLVNSEGLPMAPFKTDSDRYQYDATVTNIVNFTPMVRVITVDTKDGTAAITVKAMDPDDGIASVEVFVDDVSIGSAAKQSEGVYTISWSGSAGGHSVYAVASDTAGTTSVKQDASLGTRSVQPVRYSFNIAE